MIAQSEKNYVNGVGRRWAIVAGWLAGA